MKIKINVTRDVLERSKMCGLIPGKERFVTNCMLAVAFKDLFPESFVVARHANLLGMCGMMTAPDCVILPNIAAHNRCLFDGKTPEERVLMSPFSFEIEVPEYVIERIGISTIYKVLSESSTMEMVM
jgi:hypothetical protein